MRIHEHENHSEGTSGNENDEVEKINEMNEGEEEEGMNTAKKNHSLSICLYMIRL